MIGLGTGTIAAFARPGDVYRFYEINPLVRSWRASGSPTSATAGGKVDVVMGDGRLSLEAEPPQDYDVLALDAFSGDAIPMHLLTREAMTVYLRHLRPAGILALHITNRASTSCRSPPPRRHRLDAQRPPVLGRSERRIGRRGIGLGPDVRGRPKSWASAASPSPRAPGFRLWTDDYSNLWQVLK